MYEPFTDGARKAMQLANQEAQRLGHEYIGTEHILLGLIAEGAGVAANLLRNSAITLERARQEFDKLLQRGPLDPSACVKLPQTAQARKVIENSMNVARQMKHRSISTEHLFFGLLADRESLASLALLNCGLSLEKFRDELADLLRVDRAAALID